MRIMLNELNWEHGITTDAQGLPTLTRNVAKMLPPMSQEQNNKFWFDTLKDKHVGTAAAFGFIAVPNLTNELQVVKAGQLWERLHLWATAKGFGMQIMNQLSERRDRELSLNSTPQFGDRLREILHTSEWHSIIQFRMGYPTIEALPSPRRPVKDVLFLVFNYFLNLCFAYATTFTQALFKGVDQDGMSKPRAVL